jgi:hypothetical protein
LFRNLCISFRGYYYPVITVLSEADYIQHPL